MRALNPTISLLSCLIFTLTLTACGKGLGSLTNQELVAKNDECVQGNPTSPGRVTACENIKNECAKRRKDGNYAC